jgi:hypothetical protein
MISSSTENASAADGFKDCGQFFQPVLPRCPSALHARRLISRDISHRACSTMAAPAAARRRPDGRSTGACPRCASPCPRAFPSDASVNNALRVQRQVPRARTPAGPPASKHDGPHRPRLQLHADAGPLPELLPRAVRACGCNSLRIGNGSRAEAAVRVSATHAGATRRCGWTAVCRSASVKCL